jgi:hypothetical protein
VCAVAEPPPVANNTVGLRLLPAANTTALEHENLFYQQVSSSSHSISTPKSQSDINSSPYVPILNFKKHLTMTNPYLKDLKVDYLYHLGLDTSMDLSIFQDVEFVLMGGSAARIKGIIERAATELPSLGQRIPQGLGLATIGKNGKFQQNSIVQYGGRFLSFSQHIIVVDRTLFHVQIGESHLCQSWHGGSLSVYFDA